MGDVAGARKGADEVVGSTAHRVSDRVSIRFSDRVSVRISDRVEAAKELLESRSRRERREEVLANIKHLQPRDQRTLLKTRNRRRAMVMAEKRPLRESTG
jgi:hypothetical protein